MSALYGRVRVGGHRGTVKAFPSKVGWDHGKVLKSRSSSSSQKIRFFLLKLD